MSDIEETQEVTSSKMFIGKNMKIDEDGLLSEQIFGPTRLLKCRCGKTSGIINENEKCRYCNVLCSQKDLRLTTFGKISIIFPVIKPTKKRNILKIIGNNNQQLINPYRSDANQATQRYLALKASGEIRMVNSLEPIKNWYIIPLRITGIYSLILGFKYITYKLGLDIYRYLFDDKYIINEIKVLPPDVRPVMIDFNKKNEVRMAEINKEYTSLINQNKSNQLYKENIQVDEEDWLNKVHINFYNKIPEEIIEYAILEYDTKTAIYQYYVNRVYEEVYKTVSKKNGFIRSSFLGRTVEFSARSVIRVDPSLEPWKIKVGKKILFKLWYPYFLNFLVSIKGYSYRKCIEDQMSSKNEYKDQKDLFDEFLEWFMNNE